MSEELRRHLVDRGWIVTEMDNDYVVRKANEVFIYDPLFKTPSWLLQQIYSA